MSAVPPAVIQFIPYDEHLIFQGLQLHLAEQQPFQDLILESEANIHFLQLSLCGIIGVDFWSRCFFCQLLGVPSEEKSQSYDNSFQHKTADPKKKKKTQLIQARLFFIFGTGSHLAQDGQELTT